MNGSCESWEWGRCENEKNRKMWVEFAEFRFSYQCCWGLMSSGNLTLCSLSGSWCFKHTVTHDTALYSGTSEYIKKLLLHILGLIVLPVVVTLSFAWSVPFLACMRRWIMSGRTMPLSSRIDMVLCTSVRKKFTTELDMNLMLSNCVHETKKKYCKWYNILNANSCLYHTYLSGVGEMSWLSLRKCALARYVSSSVFCCLGFRTSPFLHCTAPSNNRVFLHLFVFLVCVES